MIIIYNLYDNGIYFGEDIFTASLKDASSFKKNDRIWLDDLGNLVLPFGQRKMPSWNTDGRPASPIEGLYGFNTDLNDLEIYNGSAWKSFVDVSEVVTLAGDETITGDKIFEGDLYFDTEGSGLPFGEISAIGVNDTITISGTGQANKVQITSFDTNGLSNNATPDHTNDHITIDKAGKYMCTVSLHVESVGAGGADLFGFSLYKNNGAAEFANVHGHRKLSGGGGDVGSISLSGIIDLAANDTVELWLWNEDSTSNVVIQDVTLSLVQIGG